MKTRKLATTLAILLISVFAITTFAPITAFAAASDDYAYYWTNQSNGRFSATWYRAQYDNGLSRWRHYEDVEYSVSGNTIYKAQTNTKVATDLKSAVKDNFGLYNKILVYIDKDGGVKAYYEDGTIKTLLTSGATKLEYNSDDVIKNVATSSGTKKIEDLIANATTITSPTDSTTIDTSTGHYVLNYKDNEGYWIWDAYRQKDFYYRIRMNSTGEVWNLTANVKLSQYCKGAKFLTVDQDYGVWLYDEVNGILYRFSNGKWKNPSTVTVNGEIKGFNFDKFGFGIEVITTSKTYKMSDLY